VNTILTILEAIFKYIIRLQEVKIAFRNVLRQRRRSLLTIGSIIAGFAFGSMSIGWRMGSFNYLIDRFTRAYLGHMQVHAEGYVEDPGMYKYIENYSETIDEIEEFTFVEACAPRLNAAGLASVGEKSDAVQLIGIDSQVEEKATNFSAKIDLGRTFSEKKNEVILGKGLIDALEAKIGDELVLVVQAADGSMGNDLYEIVGSIDAGNESMNRMGMYMEISEAQEIMVMPNSAHELIIIVDQIKKLSNYYNKIDDRLAGQHLELHTWDEINVNFARMIEAKEDAQGIMQLVIMLIVAVGVLNTILMSVLERTREFGVLKALGTRPASIFRLILDEAFIMSVIGILGGIVVGTFFNLIISKEGIPLGTGFDIGGIVVDRLKSEVNLKTIIDPGILVFFTAIIVSIFPAIRAAKTDPAKTMRFH